MKGSLRVGYSFESMDRTKAEGSALFVWQSLSIVLIRRK